MTAQRLIDHSVFQLGKALAPYITAAGILWAIFQWYQATRDDVRVFTKSVEQHLTTGEAIVKEQQLTNARLDVLIQLQAKRR